MMFSKKVFLIVIILMLLMSIGTVFAVGGGEPDGNQHPMVGGLFVDVNRDGALLPDDDAFVCSGSYAGESSDGLHDVYLTSAHCLIEWPIGTHFYVSFDNEIFDDDGPGNLVGPSVAFYGDPGYGHDMGDRHDLGVILFDVGSVADNIPPVQLPPAGYLDDLKAAKTLKDTPLELVGYGVVPVFNEPGGPQLVPPKNFPDGVRRTADAKIEGLTKSVLIVGSKKNADGYGGVCYYDSGSPQFVAGSTMIVSATRKVKRCNSNSHNYRLDTTSARDFLGQYLTLP